MNEFLSNNCQYQDPGLKFWDLHAISEWFVVGGLWSADYSALQNEIALVYLFAMFELLMFDGPHRNECLGADMRQDQRPTQTIWAEKPRDLASTGKQEKYKCGSAKSLCANGSGSTSRAKASKLEETTTIGQR